MVELLLSEHNKAQFWVPAGFAHGFVVLSENAEFLYKTTDYYAPEHEQCIAWNDRTRAFNGQTSAKCRSCLPRMLMATCGQMPDFLTNP